MTLDLAADANVVGVTEGEALPSARPHSSGRRPGTESTSFLIKQHREQGDIS